MNAAIDDVREMSRQIASMQAERARLITVARAAGQALNPVDRSGGGPQWSTEAVARREFTTELASAENLSERAAYALIETSHELAETFLHTHRALYSGDISLRHAEIIVQFGSCLPHEKQLDCELRMLELAKRQPVHILRTRAGREAKPLHSFTRMWRQICS